jgi:flagellar basal-body rod modification protein FlgD
MADQFAVLQVLQGSAMVGRNVLIEGSALSVQDGKAGAAIDLASSADTTKVEIVSPGGQILDTINLGALAAGRHSFEWDATAYTGTGAPTYRVVATSAGQPVTTTSLVRDKVVSVGSENGAMLVQLQGHNPVGYASIKAML